MRRLLASLVLILLVSVPLAGCNGAADTPAPSGTPTESAPGTIAPPAAGGSTSPSAQDPALAALVKERCTRCHNVSRIKAVQGRDAAGWQQTIERMRGRGAQLTDDQAQQLAEYFAAGGNQQLQ